MQPVNKIMQDLSGQGYFITAREKFINSYQGVYVVRQPQRALEYFLIRSNGAVLECDEFGELIENGKRGAVQIYTENRFRIVNYYDATITYNKELDTQFFYSPINRIRKIKQL